MVKHIAVLTLLLTCLIPCAASAFKLPDSDQTKCYQAVDPYAEIPCAGTGQDGEYALNPKSYTDNNDGTVTDNNTGLMWQKCSVGQNNDSSCSGSATAYIWDQAGGRCGQLTLGNHSGWRLPRKKELRSIVEYSIPAPGPTINTAYFPNTVKGLYWSLNMFAGFPYPNASWWEVNFDNGSDSVGYYDSDIGYVRCVRGGQ